MAIDFTNPKTALPYSNNPDISTEALRKSQIKQTIQSLQNNASMFGTPAIKKRTEARLSKLLTDSGFTDTEIEAVKQGKNIPFNPNVDKWINTGNTPYQSQGQYSSQIPDYVARGRTGSPTGDIPLTPQKTPLTPASTNNVSEFGNYVDPEGKGGTTAYNMNSFNNLPAAAQGPSQQMFNAQADSTNPTSGLESLAQYNQPLSFTPTGTSESEEESGLFGDLWGGIADAWTGEEAAPGQSKLTHQLGLGNMGYWTGYEDREGTKSAGALSVLSPLAGVFNAYTGYKQLGIAEDTLSHQKGLDIRNFNEQARTSNRQLWERQAYGRDKGTAVADAYLQRFGVKDFNNKEIAT